MRLAHREGPLVQPLMREEVVIFQSADLKEKKIKLINYFDSGEAISRNEHKHRLFLTLSRDLLSLSPESWTAFRWFRESI